MKMFIFDIMILLTLKFLLPSSSLMTLIEKINEKRRMRRLRRRREKSFIFHPHREYNFSCQIINIVVIEPHCYYYFVANVKLMTIFSWGGGGDEVFFMSHYEKRSLASINQFFLIELNEKWQEWNYF